MAKIIITGLPIQKAQVGLETQPSYDDQWILRMMQYEAAKGGFNNTTGKAYGLLRYGYNAPIGYKVDTSGNIVNKRDGSLYKGNWSKEQPKTLQQAVDLYKKQYLPLVSQYAEGLRERAGDFIYNTGEDPRLYMLDQYVRKYADMPLGLPDRGSYRFNQANESKFGELYDQYKDAINNLPMEEQIALMDQGRDFYYRGIQTVNGQPNPAYKATWLGRIKNIPAYKAQAAQTPVTQKPVAQQPVATQKPTVTNPPVQEAVVATKLAEQANKQAESAVKQTSIAQPITQPAVVQTPAAVTPVSKPTVVNTTTPEGATRTRTYIGVTPEEGDAMLKAAKEKETAPTSAEVDENRVSFRKIFEEEMNKARAAEATPTPVPTPTPTPAAAPTPAPVTQKPAVQATPQNTAGILAPAPVAAPAPFNMFQGIPTPGTNQMVAPAVGTKPANLVTPLNPNAVALNQQQPTTGTYDWKQGNAQITGQPQIKTQGTAEQLFNRNPNSALQSFVNTVTGDNQGYSNLVGQIESKIGQENFGRLKNANKNLGVAGTQLTSMVSGIQSLAQNERQNELAGYVRDRGSSDNMAASNLIDRGEYSVNPTSYGLFRPNLQGVDSPFGQYNAGNFYQEGGDINALTTELGNPYQTQIMEMETNIPYMGSTGSDNVSPDGSNYTSSSNATIPGMERIDGINPFAISTFDDISKEFKGVANLGYWGDKSHKKRKSDHNMGDAVDLGIKDIEMGNNIASKLVQEAADRNIKYIIFNRQIWNPTDGWKKYTPNKSNGNNPHTSHVHVSFNTPNAYVGKSNNQGSLAPEDLSIPMDADLALAAIQQFESGTKPGQSRLGIPTQLRGSDGRRATAVGTYQMTDQTITQLYNDYYKNQYSSKNAFKNAVLTDAGVEKDAARRLMQGHIDRYGVYALGAWYSPALAKKAMQGDRSVFNVIPSPEYGNKITWGDDFKRKLNQYKKLRGTSYASAANNNRRFEDGGEYELTEEEILEIKRLGGDVEFI